MPSRSDFTALQRVMDSYGLTSREQDVAGWLAEGKTNPEIASILRISVRTAEKHVENILVKLAVENRTTAAVLITRAVEA